MPYADPQAAKAYNAGYYAAHREERLVAQAGYYAAHREERLAYQAGYDAAHREERAAYSYVWNNFTAKGQTRHDRALLRRAGLL